MWQSIPKCAEVRYLILKWIIAWYSKLFTGSFSAFMVKILNTFSHRLHTSYRYLCNTPKSPHFCFARIPRRSDNYCFACITKIYRLLRYWSSNFDMKLFSVLSLGWSRIMIFICLDASLWRYNSKPEPAGTRHCKWNYASQCFPRQIINTKGNENAYGTI